MNASGLDSPGILRGAAKATNFLKGVITMARMDLLELVQEAFDKDALQEALLNRICDRIDYDELADDIISDNDCAIDQMIKELAEEDYS